MPVPHRHPTHRTTQVRRAPAPRETPPIAPVFTHMGIVDVRRGYTFPPHRHAQYETIVVDRGCYRCRLNGQALELQRHDALVIKPGDLHEDCCAPPLRFFALGYHLHPAATTAADGNIPRIFTDNIQPEQQRFRVHPGTVRPLLTRLQQEADRPDMISPHLQDAVLLEFFWHMIRVLPRPVIAERFLDLSLQQGFPAQLSRIFQANLERPLSIAAMAGRMGISQSLLAHKCRAMLGVSPARAFLGARMERAAVLLRSTSMLAKEIAPLVGFMDPYVFSRAFKRHHGVAPDSYRRQA